MQTLNSADLTRLETVLRSGDVNGFYTEMLDRGYMYAGWGRGVANGDTLAGVAALDYLQGSALKQVFEANQLGIENWTLNSVFELLVKNGGEAALERNWEAIRDTNGGERRGLPKPK